MVWVCVRSKSLESLGSRGVVVLSVGGLGIHEMQEL